MVDDGALYFCDNGRVACGKHCGMSAAYTLRDISGQRIKRVTWQDVEQAREHDWYIKCETCGGAAVFP